MRPHPRSLRPVRLVRLAMAILLPMGGNFDFGIDRAAAFSAMRDRDPDGCEQRPSEKDYAAFQSWAIGRYGRTLWDEYSAGGTEPYAHNEDGTFNDRP